MATIDSNIALGVRPLQIENPMAQYSQVAQIKNARNQNKLAELQFKNAEIEQNSINALNDAYARAYDPLTGKINNNLLRETMARSGFGSKLPGLEKTLAELEKEKLLVQKTQGEVIAQPTALAKQQTELLDAKLTIPRIFGHA